ncbi:cob(I)yrinic acid a,c-diamide adenosyltransferase [Thiolapillus brandeum]|uniref:Corrinoid adenosyltransferase n=1 Tax=Thiolapillus brandeum TaxID=1076588 RepID=A0A7U6GI48_9GAMM|nr:cob(I)yrinic acid a,c-diamide adenosyltransferase [Thiolapillus brandeum]BAO44008.1 cob(I)alamin adenosyltransferase [Thiolapillus brandeum]
MARLTRITTRTGDSGQTGLADGSRVAKDSLRIQVLGDLDELNAALGLLAVEMRPLALEVIIPDIQQKLFSLGGETALPGHEELNGEAVGLLEMWQENLNEQLPPLEEFILPGGTRAAAQAHVARAVCRRTERSLWRLSHKEKVNFESLKYLNRLSDLLFDLARFLNHEAGAEETTWKREK